MDCSNRVGPPNHVSPDLEMVDAEKQDTKKIPRPLEIAPASGDLTSKKARIHPLEPLRVFFQQYEKNEDDDAYVDLTPLLRQVRVISKELNESLSRANARIFCEALSAFPEHASAIEEIFTSEDFSIEFRLVGGDLRGLNHEFWEQISSYSNLQRIQDSVLRLISYKRSHFYYPQANELLKKLFPTIKQISLDIIRLRRINLFNYEDLERGLRVFFWDTEKGHTHLSGTKKKKIEFCLYNFMGIDLLENPSETRWNIYYLFEQIHGVFVDIDDDVLLSIINRLLSLTKYEHISKKEHEDLLKMKRLFTGFAYLLEARSLDIPKQLITKLICIDLALKPSKNKEFYIRALELLQEGLIANAEPMYFPIHVPCYLDLFSRPIPLLNTFKRPSEEKILEMLDRILSYQPKIHDGSPKELFVLGMKILLNFTPSPPSSAHLAIFRRLLDKFKVKYQCPSHDDIFNNPQISSYLSGINAMIQEAVVNRQQHDSFQLFIFVYEYLLLKRTCPFENIDSGIWDDNPFYRLVVHAKNRETHFTITSTDENFRLYIEKKINAGDTQWTMNGTTFTYKLGLEKIL